MARPVPAEVSDRPAPTEVGNRPAPTEVGDIALLGTGTIGASWATYFLARGLSVTA